MIIRFAGIQCLSAMDHGIATSTLSSMNMALWDGVNPRVN
jgi:hypothetical protein